ncbi:WecB/TagA/CpsF family glycosyltransferase [Agromyces sp. Root81]|uniref:WecB/TagA/CpsF family glycosyltransferase n=1 Tax=Agromyces sp. Root81 TaxID=1736601 RepID=UPI000AD9A06F|nr:WecB/TagA/CpsF family glycosyltransferase [Agromyces sp. Root81]
MSATVTRVRLGGVPVDLLGRSEAIDTISSRFEQSVGRPLGVASINLDHVHYFGDAAPVGHALHDGDAAPVEWLNLVDGAPLAAAARRITHRDWPRLAGSDLIDPLLDRAELAHSTVGFIGGTATTHEHLARRLALTHPVLRLAGCWAPDRAELVDDAVGRAIADDIAAHEVGLLIVCLGKPRQELWIERYGAATGSRVLLAFGAVVDFLAGRIGRAPRWVADHGMEWAWRLALEPRRLAHRYLVDGPPAYLAVRRSSGAPSGAGPERRAAG